eukprot:94274-Amphidinium_carterae.2
MPEPKALNCRASTAAGTFDQTLFNESGRKSQGLKTVKRDLETRQQTNFKLPINRGGGKQQAHHSSVSEWLHKIDWQVLRLKDQISSKEDGSVDKGHKAGNRAQDFNQELTVLLRSKVVVRAIAAYESLFLFSASRLTDMGVSAEQRSA